MKVFVTGGSGFIAAHCIDQLLQRDHSVVCSVRSDLKGQQVLKANPEVPPSKLSYVIVDDVAKDRAFDDAVKSEPPFDAVLHTASPFHLNIEHPKELLEPAIKGTTGILQAVKRFAPSVKRVVVTSSFAAMLNAAHHPKTYEEAIWNPITWDEALLNAGNAYRASKVFAEKAAWDFVEKEKPSFDIVTLNPPLVLGPVAHSLSSLGNINTSNKRIVDIIQGNCKEGLPPSLGVYLWADVRDVAMAHVLAAEVSEAGGKRFLIAADSYVVNADIAQVIKDKFAGLAHQLPTVLERESLQDVYGYDNSRSKEVLGVQYRNLDACVVDTVDSLLQVKS